MNHTTNPLLIRFNILSIAAVWGLLFATLISWLFPRFFLSELFTHFRHIYLLGGLICLAWFLLRKARLHGACAIVVVLGNIAPVLGLMLPQPVSPVENPAAYRKILMANVLYINRDHQKLLDLVRQENPDLVLLVEVSQAWEQALQPLNRLYPHRLMQSEVNPFGLAVLSREALAEAKLLSHDSDGFPLALLYLTTPNGPLNILLDHPMAPVGAPQAAMRNSHLQATARLAAELEGPLVVTGDLNTTMWSPYFRDLVHTAKLRDGRRGFGILGTWPGFVPFFKIPIDHVLVRQVHIRKLKTGPHIGSDHLPLIMELAPILDQ